MVFLFNFKLEYKSQYKGDTIWQRIKTIFIKGFNKGLVCDKSSGGYYGQIFFIKFIDVILPAWWDALKRDGVCDENNKHYNYDELSMSDIEDGLAYCIEQTIAHEYMHCILFNVNTKIDIDQQHYIINKIGFW